MTHEVDRCDDDAASAARRAEHATPRSERMDRRDGRRITAASFGEREMATRDGRWIRIAKHPTREGGVVTLVTDLTDVRDRQRDLETARDEAAAAHRRLILAMEATRRRHRLPRPATSAWSCATRPTGASCSDFPEIVAPGVALPDAVLHAAKVGAVPPSETPEAWTDRQSHDLARRAAGADPLRPAEMGARVDALRAPTAAPWCS